ncbi:MAG: DNA translocase FtsK, partial [Lachnospiraceae bacterium]
EGDIYSPQIHQTETHQTEVHHIEKPAAKKAETENIVETDMVKASGAQNNNIAGGIISKANNTNARYQFPPIELLEKSTNSSSGAQKNINDDMAVKLRQTLLSFGVKADIDNITCGPSVTRFELKPEQGVKVSKIVSLSDDIKLSLAATDIRIEAPVPGKSTVGIEVPNKVSTGVKIRELIESDMFKKHSSNIVFAAGKDIAGQVVLADIAKMPHLLIAGATGSGKSVCINTIIMSILYRARPEDVKLIMIDPKVVELSVYNGIPHLMIPVVTDPKKASAALNWAVAEMTDRYNKFAEKNVRDLKGYNERIEKEGVDENGNELHKLPQIVIIVDELADLMMVAPGEVEDAICRLAQLARAAGIHLIIATQRPSVNVITGVIKANIPSRIAFSVASAVDSRTILDMSGAEKLLGKGDMLFYPSGYPKPIRVQGAFVSDNEVGKVVEFLKQNAGEADYSKAIENHMENSVTMNDSAAFGGDRDSYFGDAGRFIIEKEKGSIGMLQRYFKIGFNRAARIMDQLADAGVVGPEEGTKPRKILMTMEEFEEYIKK